MGYKKFKGKYIPNFESENQKYGNIATKAFTDYAPCLCNCANIDCADCILHSRNHCIEYFKQHRELMQNWIDRLVESRKQ